MTGSTGHAAEGWRDADVVVAAFAGTRAGGAAVVPAIRVLRAALPRATLLLLWPEEAAIPPRLSALADRCLEYPSPHAETRRAGRDAVERVVAVLAAAAARGAVVFTESGWAPYVPAYLVYLAGIARRAGITAEFGGAVLSQPIAPPPREMPEEARHLFLLEAIGFDRRGAMRPDSGLAETSLSLSR